MDGADSIAQAAAIKDGLIQAVGSDEVVRTLSGDRTRIIDLRGKAVTPGLVDSHNHFQVMGLMHGYYTPFLPPDVRTITDLQDRLAETVACHAV